MARIGTMILLLSGPTLSGQVDGNQPIQMTIYEGSGLPGPTRQVELNEAGLLRFEYRGSKKAKAQTHNSTISSNEARVIVGKMVALLSAIDSQKVNQSKCFDGTTYRFSIQAGNHQRLWVFYNIPDLRSISPALSEFVNELSKSAPQAFRIFTTMPQGQSE